MHKLFHFQLDFPDDHIAVNIGALLDAITLHRNQLPKSMIVEICIKLEKVVAHIKMFSFSPATFVKRAVLSSTYGPGFPVDIRPFLK